MALLRYGAYSISKIAIISAGVTTIGVCGITAYIIPSPLFPLLLNGFPC